MKNKTLVLLSLSLFMMVGCNHNPIGRLLGLSDKNESNPPPINPDSPMAQEIEFYVQGDIRSTLAGQYVYFGLRNNGEKPHILPLAYPFEVINSKTNEHVFSPPDQKQGPVELAPGNSIEYAWNHTYDSGEWVLPGKYRIIAHLTKSDTRALEITIEDDAIVPSRAWSAFVLKPIYIQGEPVKFGLENIGDYPVPIPYPIHYFVKNLDSGKIVIDTRLLNPVFGMYPEPIRPLERIYTAWDQRNLAGNNVPSGQYRLTFIIPDCGQGATYPSVEFRIENLCLLPPPEL